VDTNEFIDVTAPEVLYAALEPITPPAGTAACATHDPRQFASSQRQQAAFDGDPVDPVVDYPAARAICLGCPLLAACRWYADASREEDTFLAGLSADQRSTQQRKKTEMAKRRLQVAALRAIGAPTPVIAEITGRDPSLIRADIRDIAQSARPAA
jgi:hypothetical protein